MGSTEFDIYALDVGGGQVGLSPIPGRSGSYETDLSQILHWGADLVLTMTTIAELDRMGAHGLGDDLAMAGVAWRLLPIQDFGAPEADVRRVWPDVSQQAATVLGRGGKVLSHCFGGCGRSGMVALRLMVEAGEAPEGALARLRRTRPCAVERDSQFDWAASAAV